MAQPNGVGSKWKFDATLNLSAILAALIIIIPIIGSAYVLRAQVESIEGKVDNSFGKVEDRLRGVEDAVLQLRLENAKRDGMAQEIAELKSRLRTLETGKP